MSITIERLDNEDLNRDILIVTGNDIIFKLYIKKSIYTSNPEIQKFISVEGLCEKKNLDKINEFKSLNNEKKDIVDFFWNIGDRAKDFLGEATSNEDLEKRKKIIIRVDKKRLGKKKNRLKEISDQILLIQRSFGVNFNDPKKFVFCNQCNFLISEKEIFSNLKCFICGKEITRSHIRVYNFLNEKIANYLKGDWFSDYIAKGFKSQGWKTWTNLYVLGASGIPHEIDVLAINKKQKEALIGECKTGKVTRSHVFNFFTKSQDIHGSFSYFFNVNEIPELDTKKFMERNGILFIDNIPLKKEKELFDQIFQDLYGNSF